MDIAIILLAIIGALVVFLIGSALTGFATIAISEAHKKWANTPRTEKG